MKAIVYDQYGPPEVLKLADVQKPVPNDNEILVKIKAASVNFGDITARDFKSMTPRKFNMPFLFWLPAKMAFGANKPKIRVLGSEFAGTVEAVGKGVKRFKQGDCVFGYRGSSFGSYAEYLCMPEDGLVAIKPAALSFEEAAGVPYGAITSYNLLKKAHIARGKKVLVNGASGSIGSFALQLAKHYGADVTGVCGTKRQAFVKALGADRVIDYTKEDFTQSGETYDLIIDVLGKLRFSQCKNALNKNGRVLYASFKMRQLIQAIGTSIKGGRKVICALSTDESAQNLEIIRDLIEAGHIKTVIDKSYPLNEAADAHRYVESGQKLANVVLVTQ